MSTTDEKEKAASDAGGADDSKKSVKTEGSDETRVKTEASAEEEHEDDEDDDASSASASASASGSVSGTGLSTRQGSAATSVNDETANDEQIARALTGAESPQPKAKLSASQLKRRSGRYLLLLLLLLMLMLARLFIICVV